MLIRLTAAIIAALRMTPVWATERGWPPMPNFGAQAGASSTPTRAEAEKQMQDFGRDIVSLNQGIARLTEMLAHPETDCVDVNSLSLSTEECANLQRTQRNIIADDEEREIPMLQAAIDRGADAFIADYLKEEAQDRQYLKTHWWSFPTQDILDCTFVPDFLDRRAAEQLYKSYSALYSCLVISHGNK
jgi:hypothetical protein